MKENGRSWLRTAVMEEKLQKKLRLGNSKLEGDKIELSQIKKEKKAGSVTTVYVTSSLIASFFYFQTCLRILLKETLGCLYCPDTLRSVLLSYKIPEGILAVLNFKYKISEPRGLQFLKVKMETQC